MWRYGNPDLQFLDCKFKLEPCYFFLPGTMWEQRRLIDMNVKIMKYKNCECIFHEWAVCGNNLCKACGNCANKKTGWESCTWNGISIGLSRGRSEVKHCPTNYSPWMGESGKDRGKEFRRRQSWPSMPSHSKTIYQRVCKLKENNPCKCD